MTSIKRKYPWWSGFELDATTSRSWSINSTWLVLVAAFFLSIKEAPSKVLFVLVMDTVMRVIQHCPMFYDIWQQSWVWATRLKEELSVYIARNSTESKQNSVFDIGSNEKGLINSNGDLPRTEFMLMLSFARTETISSDVASPVLNAEAWPKAAANAASSEYMYQFKNQINNIDRGNHNFIDNSHSCFWSCSSAG